MDARESGKVVEHLAAMKRTLVDMGKSSERAAKALERITLQQDQTGSPMLYEAAPVLIDWESPAISGVAQAYKTKDTTQIVITIDPRDTNRIDALIRSGFVDVLRLSVMDKS